MPIRTSGGVFSDQMLTGSLAHYVVCGADFSGAVNSFGQPVPFSAAEIIFKNIEAGAYVNIMNPNECNLSFALEADRSIWTADTLQVMIQGLGTDVGVDHIDCSVCTVEQVPYIWSCGNGSESFLDLIDTPSTYAGSAGYVVSVNGTEDGLIFTPATASNAFAFVSVPTEPTLTAIGSDVLTIVPGSNIVITTNSLTNELTINSTASGSNDYIPVPAGTTLDFSEKYFVTTTGTVFLPLIGIGNTPGQSVTITKPIGITVFVNANTPSDNINTDLGSTDIIEYDATEELIFIVSGIGNWELQIGSVN